MFKKNFIILFVGGIILVPLAVFGLIKWYEHNYKTLPVYPSKPGADFSYTLMNQEGKPITEKDGAGKIRVVDFFFTHCPGVCPKMTNSLVRVQQVYKDQDFLQIFSFSVNPEGDSVPRLASYANKFNINNKNWSLLTGDKITIYRLARNRFNVVATDGDGGPNDFIHSEQLVLLDTKGRIRGYYDGTSESAVDQLIVDIKKLKKTG